LRVKNWQKLATLWEDALSCKKKKNLEIRIQPDEPVECTSAGDPLLLHKILHLLFFPLARIICALRLESGGDYQHGLNAGPLEFKFLRARRCLTIPFRILWLCFGVIGKTPSLISCNNFVKKFFLSASAIVIISWQDVTQSSLCAGVKGVEQNAHTTFFFPNPLSESEKLQSWECSKILLSFLMRFDGHF